MIRGNTFHFKLSFSVAVSLHLSNYRAIYLDPISILPLRDFKNPNELNHEPSSRMNSQQNWRTKKRKRKKGKKCKRIKHRLGAKFCQLKARAQVVLANFNSVRPVFARLRSYYFHIPLECGGFTFTTCFPIISCNLIMNPCIEENFSF